ncbi:recombinase family protein [Cellulomonas soli]|uniref:Putative resolvase/invertase/recombinase n=1 Tax=Cellulomonas soli TaxID=931535 RepID=A0A512PDU4_9CELL|nr:recombinase family protein [Cellulomonas soli]NYI59140.1 DNA invertase Pin-like site-specific DNA recombinase [Cellulomonas soli]GEP69368.1 putative resolvase/invertase/recombinase [Cellulomonas soli]
MTTPATAPQGQTIAYCRVSTTAQHLDRQLAAMEAAGVPAERVFVDKRSGATTQREGLQAMLAYARSGDTVLVYTLDRLGRSLRDTLNLVHDLRERGIGLRTLADPLPIDTTDENPTATIALSLLALFSELERVYNRERVAHARAVMEAKGGRVGRPRRLSDEQIRYAAHLRDTEGLTVPEIARRLEVGVATLYRHLPQRPESAPTASGERPVGR